MKVVSIDLETTGLDPNEDQILEIGLVAYDTKQKFAPTHSNTLRIVFCHERIKGNIFAINMNAGILSEIKEKKEHLDKSNFWFTKDSSKGVQTYYFDMNTHVDILYVNIKDVIDDFLSVNECLVAINNESNGKVTVTGKNFSSFDKRFIDADPILSKCLYNIIRYRVLDIGPLFVNPGVDEVIPDLKECSKRAGLDNIEVSHISTDDAIQVIRCLEYALNSRFPKK